MVSKASVLILCFIQVSLGDGCRSIVTRSPTTSTVGPIDISGAAPTTSETKLAVQQGLKPLHYRAELVNIEDVPYMASVHVGGSSCSGSIINQRFVLTAAHCIKKENRTTDHVRVGTSRRNNGGQKYSIAEYITHENYELGLLKLSRSLTFGSTVAKIDLAPSTLTISNSMYPHLTGWGRTTPEMRSRRLYDRSILMTDLLLCMMQANNNRLTNKSICALFYGAETCKGDSGGALVVGSHQIGVFLTGDDENCTRTMAGVYANATAHSDWINYHLHQ